MTPMFMGLGTGELIVILIIVVLLFGAAKIPELMKGVGKGVKSYKDAVNGVDEAARTALQDTEEPKKD